MKRQVFRIIFAMFLFQVSFIFVFAQSETEQKIILSPKFGGIWAGQIPKRTIVEFNSKAKTTDVTDCVFCAQFVPDCGPNQILVLQTCTECAHCENIEDVADKGDIKTREIAARDNKEKIENIKLKLDVKGGKLTGKIIKGFDVKNAEIISQSIISENKAFVTFKDKNENNVLLNLELVSDHELNIGFPNGDTFKLIKKGAYKSSLKKSNSLSADTRIRTKDIEKKVVEIKEGDIVLTTNNIAVPVIKTSMIEAKEHKILKIKFNDATVLEISPAHPTADGRLFKDLKTGDLIDRRIVVESKLIMYPYKYTYDILPDSKTGNYYANGILVGSTLKK